MIPITESIFKHILTVVIVIVTLVYVYFKWAFSYWRRKGVENVPATIPFGGASKVLTRKTSFGVYFKEVYEKYKTECGFRYVGFYLFAKPTIVLLDINLIKSVMTKDFHHFTDHGNYVNEDDEPLTGHLFALKGQRWKHLRTKLTPTFTSGKIKMMFHTLVDCSTGLKEVMDDLAKQDEAADIKDVVARYTTDVIGTCAFGLDCNSLKNPNSEFRTYGKQIFSFNIFKRFVRFLALVSPQVVAKLHLRFLNTEVSEFIMNVVKQTVEYRENNNVKRNDFMHLLIQLKNNVQLKEDEDIDHLKNDNTVDDGLTIEQLAAQVFVFFVAGFETSSTTLAFCLFELVCNPDIQEHLRAEIRGTLKKHDNRITYDAIMQMTFMDKCIQETLRKYPPFPLLFRECTESYTIPESNVLVEKGTLVFIPILGIHHDPEFYPNPEKFDPERFSVENKENREHFAWLPFGEGPRVCIGMRFGLMQTKVALAVLLKDYEFTLNNKTETPLVMSTEGIGTAAKGGIWLNVKKHT